MAGKKTKKRIVKKQTFSSLKVAQSYTSLVLGAIVVLVVGILFISFAKGNRGVQTSSIRDNSNIESQQNTSSTYTVKPGDDLWSISENIYNNGYKWVEIARINKLKDPGLIHVGNKLMMPTVSQEAQVTINSGTSAKTTDTILKNNSISGNSYTVEKGDSLWNIAVRAYGDGFKWPDIARANNLENPSLIFSGNVLQIPRQ